MRSVRRLTAVIGAALATLAFASTAATAAPATPSGVEPPLFRVTAEQGALFHHDGQHYGGTVALTIRNVGRDPATSVLLRIGIPKGLKFQGLYPSTPCFIYTTEAVCQVFRSFEPDDESYVYAWFEAFAAPAEHARITSTATVVAEPSAGSGGSASFAAILVGTDGSSENPQPYEPATSARTVVTATADLVPEGPPGNREFTARVHVSIHAGNDIPNEIVRLSIIAPPGSGSPRFDPPSSCFPICEAPGGWMAGDETRKFDIFFSYSGTTAPVNETVGIRVDMLYRGDVQPETPPAQNSVTVPLVEA